MFPQSEKLALQKMKKFIRITTETVKKPIVARLKVINTKRSGFKIPRCLENSCIILIETNQSDLAA